MKILHSLLFLMLFISSSAQVSTSQKAKQAYDKKDYKEAAKLYTKVINDNAATHLDHYYRANAYLELKNLQGAYDDYTMCIKLAGDFSEAYLIRGILLTNPQQIQEALNDLNMAVKYAKQDTTKTQALVSRASAKLYMQNYESAMKDCNEALKIDSVSQRARGAMVNLSTCYGYLKQPEKALNTLKKLYLRDSSDLVVIGNLGYELTNQKRYAESVYYFDRALKIRPNDAYTLSNKSYAYLNLGKVDEALDLIERSIKQDPTNSYAYKNKGLIWLGKNNKAKACEAFDMAQKKGYTEVYGNEVVELIKENCD